GQANEQKAAAAAQAARERKEHEEAQYRESMLRTLYADANAAFLNQNYARAEALCQQILLEDPGNKAATELLQVARDARHTKTDDENRQHYREQWIRTMEEVDTMDIPQDRTIVFNDLKRWAIVSVRTPLEFSHLDPIQSQDKQIVLDRLDAARIAPHFVGANGEGTPLEEVAGFLQRITGVNF